MRTWIEIALVFGAISCAGSTRTEVGPSDAQPPVVLTRAKSTSVSSATSPTTTTVTVTVTVRASPQECVALGRSIFFDATLSTPAGTSCASCHDPRRAFSGDHGSTTGLPRGSRPDRTARRTSPSLFYLRYVPRFRYYQEGDDHDSEPVGGFFWDGRVDSIADLTRQPLLNPDEMNAAGGAAIAERIAAGPYAGAFRRAFGDVLGDPEATLAAAGRAVEAFLLSDAMAPFSSRFDAFVRGEADLTSKEKAGLRLFQDPKKGACNRCHRVEPGSRDPARSLFTDYGYDAVGAPRNPGAGAHPPDLGLCERTDTTTPSNEPRYCASFRTPSLRNVALRSSFMHNGAFRRLRDVVAFYATRDTHPRRWYPSGTKFDDVPPAYRGHVNVNEPPYGRQEGNPPALDEREIDAVVAFLETLTDRFPPP